MTYRALRLCLPVVVLAGPACRRPRRSPSPPDAAPASLAAPAADAGMGPAGVALVECAAADRENVEVLLDQASIAFDAGDHAESLACAEAAARLAPDSVRAHDDRAAALAALGRLDEASEAYAHALALDPDDPLTLADAADHYVNRLDATRERTLIGLEYALRGSARVGRGKEDRRLAARLALLESQALDDLGQSDLALPRVEAALALDAGNEEARYQRGLVLFHLCRFDAARRALSEVVERLPDDAYAHHNLGLVLERLGETAAAEQHLARARALDPEQFPPPVLIPDAEFRAIVDRAIADLDAELRASLDGVPVQVADLPAIDDLLAVDPPFSPTILGLCRGAPIGGVPAPEDEPRAIVLYRKNLGRAVRDRRELERQIRLTLWHELGHLRGADEEDLRARGLE